MTLKPWLVYLEVRRRRVTMFGYFRDDIEVDPTAPVWHAFNVTLTAWLDVVG